MNLESVFSSAICIQILMGNSYILCFLFLCYDTKGMTETCSSLTFMTLHDPTLQNSGKFISKNFESSTDSILHSSGIYVGKPAPHVELCIGGGNLDYGPASGRILTRGAHVMEGYWDGFAAVVPESSKHGWFDTGDIGWIDDQGDLWLMGRIKDRIKSGGENVYPQEVII